MKKTKFYAAAFAALFAVVFSACKDNGGNDNPPTPDPEPTKVEMTSLKYAGVDVIKGESAYTKFELYRYTFTNKDETEAYGFIFNSLANDLAGVSAGKYTLKSSTSMLQNVEEAIFAKSSSGSTSEIIPESGDVEVKTGADGIEITATVTFADGSKYIYHYKGAAPEKIEQNDVLGAGEPTEKKDFTVTADTLVSYSGGMTGVQFEDGSTVPAYILSILPTDENLTLDKVQEMRLFFYFGATEDATELLAGDYTIADLTNENISSNLVLAGNAITVENGLVSLVINGVDNNGYPLEIYWPQTGTVKVEKNGELYSIYVEMDTYFGSKIKAEVKDKKIGIPTDESASIAPAKLAPKVAPAYDKSFMPKARFMR